MHAKIVERTVNFRGQIADTGLPEAVGIVKIGQRWWAQGVDLLPPALA